MWQSDTSAMEHARVVSSVLSMCFICSLVWTTIGFSTPPWMYYTHFGHWHTIAIVVVPIYGLFICSAFVLLDIRPAWNSGLAQTERLRVVVGAGG